VAVDLVKGEFGIEDDTGSGGPAAISASTYGYQSINLDHAVIPVRQWVTENPNAVWVVEMYRDGEMFATLATDSSNATGNNQIEAPDGTSQYGTGMWWRTLVQPQDFRVGDVWIVYGWKDMGNFIIAYPPDRFVK